MRVEIKIDLSLWRLIKKIVMNSRGDRLSITEWVEDAIREKILREPTY